MGIKQRAEIISKNLNFSKKEDIYYRLNRLISVFFVYCKYWKIFYFFKIYNSSNVEQIKYFFFDDLNNRND